MTEAEPLVSIIADDLTGAADTGVTFADAGWATHLVRGEAALPSSGAVTRTLDTRAASTDVSARRTAQAVAEASAQGALIYIKVDSTLRGTVAAQVSGALTGRRIAHPGAFAVVCPAYPAMGRTVRDGVLLVDDVPVHLTAAGSDPVNPMRTPELAELLPGSVAMPAPASVDDALAGLRDLGAPGAVIHVDATGDEHLVALAGAIAVAGADVLPVGAAGLARQLARAWLPATSEPRTRRPRRRGHRAVVMRSSANAMSRDQIAALRDGKPDLRVEIVEAPDRDSGTTDPVAVAHDLAAQVAERVDAGADTLVLLGGDGAEAVLDALSRDTLRVLGSVVEGVPLLESPGPGRPLLVATKAGGFGHRDTLRAILEELM